MSEDHQRRLLNGIFTPDRRPKTNTKVPITFNELGGAFVTLNAQAKVSGKHYLFIDYT